MATDRTSAAAATPLTFWQALKAAAVSASSSRHRGLLEQVFRNLVQVEDRATDAAIKAKYMLALINKVHMEADLEMASELPALAGTEDQTDTDTQANAIRDYLSDHLTDVGTAFADGAHKVADTALNATLAAIPDATDLASCKTLIDGMVTAINAHLDSSGVHFHDDEASALEVTFGESPTLGEARTACNDVRQFILTHNSLASF